MPWKVWHPRVAPKRDADGNIIKLSDGTLDLGPGVARWFVEEGADDIHLEAIKGPHAEERRCKAAASAGASWTTACAGSTRIATSTT